MSIPRRLILLLSLPLISPSVQAQQVSASYLSVSPLSPAFRPGPGPGRRIAVSHKGSYWAEVGGVGALLLGLAGLLYIAAECATEENNSSTSCPGSMIGAGFLGAGVGFTVGALIGARFPKH